MEGVTSKAAQRWQRRQVREAVELSQSLAAITRWVDDSIAERGDFHHEDALRMLWLEQELHDVLHLLKDRGELHLARDAGMVMEVVPQAAARHTPECSSGR